MEETVNIPLLVPAATGRRRSDTPAGRRNGPLKAVVISSAGKSALDGDAESTERPRAIGQRR